MVNGVTFGGSLTQGGISLSDSAFTGGGTNGVTAVPATMSSAYQSVLQDLVYTGGATSFSLTGLTPGHTYDLQLFSGSTGPTGTQTLNDGASIGYLDYNMGPSSNSFVIDQFVATTGGTETIGYAAGTYDIINAVNVRDLGIIVPEPSTYALMLGGLAVLAFCIRPQVRTGQVVDFRLIKKTARFAPGGFFCLWKALTM